MLKLAYLRLLTLACLGFFSVSAVADTLSSSEKYAVCGLSTQGNQSFIGASTPPSNALEEAYAHAGVYKAANVATLWWQLEPCQGAVTPGTTSVASPACSFPSGDLEYLHTYNGQTYDFAAIESALQTITTYNMTYPATQLTANLQVFAGKSGPPTWIKDLPNGYTGSKALNGPITISGTTETLGFFQGYYLNSQNVPTPNPYGLAWTALQNALAAVYDADPRIQQVQVTSCSSSTAEPFVLDSGSPVYTAVLTGDPNFDLDYQACFKGAATIDYAAWQITALNFPFNQYTHVESDTTAIGDGNFTNTIMGMWALNSDGTRNLRHLTGNHALQGPAGTFVNSGPTYPVPYSAQKAVVYTGSTATTNNFATSNGLSYYRGTEEFQLDGTPTGGAMLVSTNGVVNDFDELDSAIRAGLSYGMTDFEMWETAATAPNNPNSGLFDVTSAQLLAWEGLFTCTPVTLAVCGSAGAGYTASGGTANVMSQTSLMAPASAQECPNGGTDTTTTTTTQPSICINGTYQNNGNPTSTPNTVTLCNANASCSSSNGTIQSGNTTPIITFTPGSTNPSVQQCPYGGTQATTTAITQLYLCTNGTLAPQGPPSSMTTDNGNPICNAPAACSSVNGIIPSGMTTTITTYTNGSKAATSQQCPYGGIQATITSSAQIYLCTNGTLATQGTPTPATTNSGNPACDGATCKPTS